MRAHLHLNISDVDTFIREGLAKRYPGVEVTGYTVLSWRQPILEVQGDMLETPVRHVIRAEHRETPQ